VGSAVSAHVYSSRLDAFFLGLGPWRQRARWAQHKLNAAPSATRIIVIVATILAVFCAANLVYQVVRKPTEMFFPVSSAMNKTPAETWRQYGPLFREYSTTSITPELLAALAQVEGAGNSLAKTYWRWRLPGIPLRFINRLERRCMYQMTDAAFARHDGIAFRHHTVVEDGCWLNGLYTRVLPSHAIELTAVFPRPQPRRGSARRPNAIANQQQKQAVAAMIHLCGAASPPFTRRGFHLTPTNAAATTRSRHILRQVTR